MSEETKISINTWIPIGLAVSVCGAIAGGTIWLSTLNSDVQYLKKQVAALEQTNERLARIETTLDEIKRQLITKK